MKRVAQYMFIVLLSLALTSCAELQRYEIQRTVQDNLFSSNFPELKLKIDPVLNYIGKAERVVQEATANPNNKDIQDSTSSYLFGQAGPQGRLLKGVLIRLTVVRGDPSKARTDLSTQGKDIPLDSGILKILSDEYDYTLRIRNDLFTQEESGIFASVSMAPCYLVKLLEKKAGLGNKSLVQIFYFEDLSSDCPSASCNSCLQRLSDESKRQQVLGDFDERSYQVISFMEPKKIVDATSRYVRPENEEVTPTELAPQGRKGEGASGSIESRLKILKDLLDKNLISREDYEKKKAEILNGL